MNLTFKKLLFILLLFSFGCSNNNDKNFETKIKDLEEQLSQIQKEKSSIENDIERLKSDLVQKQNEIDKIIMNRGEMGDYYLFVPTKNGEINVYEQLPKGTKKAIDRKHLTDTLDNTDDPGFVYEHDAIVFQTENKAIEAFLSAFDQQKSTYTNGFFVRVITLYSGNSLSLEVENSTTDVHIIIKPTELGEQNKTFIISDFYNLQLIDLKPKDDYIELSFQHGEYPVKTEKIMIKPQLVKFL